MYVANISRRTLIVFATVVDCTIATCGHFASMATRNMAAWKGPAYVVDMISLKYWSRPVPWLQRRCRWRFLHRLTIYTALSKLFDACIYSWPQHVIFLILQITRWSRCSSSFSPLLWHHRSHSPKDTPCFHLKDLF